MSERGKMAMCAGGSSEIKPGFVGAGKHHETAGLGQRIVDAGDSDVGGGAGLFQLVAIGETGVDLRESSDAALT